MKQKSEVQVFPAKPFQQKKVSVRELVLANLEALGDNSISELFELLLIVPITTAVRPLLKRRFLFLTSNKKHLKCNRM